MNSRMRFMFVDQIHGADEGKSFSGNGLNLRYNRSFFRTPLRCCYMFLATCLKSVTLNEFERIIHVSSKFLQM